MFTPEEVPWLFIGTPSKTIKALLPLGSIEPLPLNVILVELSGPEPADNKLNPATLPDNALAQLLGRASVKSLESNVCIEYPKAFC